MLNKNFLKIIPLSMGVLILSLVLGYVILAWTEPAGAPPEGNVAAPLNTSGAAQTKTGALNVMGKVGVGNTSPTQQLDVTGYVNGRTGLCIHGDCITEWGQAGAFGGFYTLAATSNWGRGGQFVCAYPNPYTGQCTCPIGFNAWPFGMSLISEYYYRLLWSNLYRYIPSYLLYGDIKYAESFICVIPVFEGYNPYNPYNPRNPGW
jgi:hypothetical protein